MKKIINPFWKGFWIAVIIFVPIVFVLGCFFKRAEVLVDIFLAIMFFMMDIDVEKWNITWLVTAVISIFAIWFTFHKLKKEIIFKRRLDIYEKVTDRLIGLYEIYFEFTPFTNNEINIKEFNPKRQDDLYGKHINEANHKLIKVNSEFGEKFQELYTFLEMWKAIFSKNMDYELKFLYDLGCIFYEKVDEYRNALSDLVYLSAMMSNEEIIKLKKKLLKLDKEVNKLSTCLSNALGKFIFDLGEEVFGEFCKKSDKKRLFSLEIENTGEGIDLPILTPGGFEIKKIRKSEFQKEFGVGRERQEKIREIILKLRK